LVIVQGNAGDRSGAKKALEQILKEIDPRDGFNRALIDAHIAIGDFRTAYRAIHQPFVQETWRADALRDLAEAQAACGDAAGAYPWAGAETEPLLRACALAGLAAGMIKHQQSGKAPNPPISAPTAEDVRTKPAPRVDHSGEYRRLVREHEAAIQKFNE